MLIHPKTHFQPYTHASGGWGSAKSVMQILWREQALTKAPVALLKQNKPDGFACVSCAWAKSGRPHALEFCENGAKATAWELTSLKTDPAFFAAHTLSELRDWPDYALEQQGRLTHPLRYDPQSDRYRETSWDEAYQAIGAQLKAMEPDSVVFYASGRASLETSFMYQLFARAYGTNNLPDSSNMCHESTSVGLQESIGVPVGTVTLDDFEHTDCLFFFRPERRQQQPAHAASIAGRAPARRADHHLQPFARARAGALRQSAIAQRNAHARVDPDQYPIPPGGDWRGHGRHHRHRQGAVGNG
jgi:anaerobic selenocysteine-containing dehydrogenase